MTTLVTGASGFVGAAVVRRLIAAGHEVRVMTRPTSDPRNYQDLGVEAVHGDLDDAASLATAVRGCDALFHVAADYRLWIPKPEAIYRTNVDGSEALMRAAADAGVARIVYTSSVAVLGNNPNYEQDGIPADEETPVTEAAMIGHYKRSKYLAEERVRSLVENEGLPAVIVNPAAPIGPRDVKPTPTGKMVVDAAAGKMPAYVDTGLCVVHVEDVAEGHWLAFEKGQIGRRYILGGENLSLHQILGKIAAITGGKPPTVKLPVAALMPIARIMELIARVTGNEPLMTADSLKMAKKRMYFSSARAQTELGYAPRPADAALADAIQWFRENGYLD